ncbi:MAG: hypothetical protein ACFB0A_11285 [Croceivirga sp.]
MVAGAHTYGDRSFVRLQDVRLAYNFPEKLVDKLGVDKFRIYLTGKNLYTWTDWIGPDPELSDRAFDLGGGRAAPILTSYALGLNLTF